MENEIERLGATKLIVIGGENSVSSSSISSLNVKDIERVHGKDRYETANKVYDKLKDMGKVSKSAIIASGEGFADALSIGGITGKEKSPIILIKKNETPKEVREYLRKLKKFEVVGGNSTIDRSQFKKK